MIERYSRPEISAHFTDEARLASWLKVEQVVLHVLAEHGIATHDAVVALDGLEKVDADAVSQREAEIHHDLAAFVDTVAKQVPEAQQWLHYGLTSSDVVDTALALRLQAAGGVVLHSLDDLRNRIAERASEHRTTPMLGRTHGMPAEPTTFGMKLLGWWHQLARDRERLAVAFEGCSVGKISGAVGTWSVLSPQVEADVLLQLGLGRDESSTQIVQRDRHAQLLTAAAIAAGTIERVGLEVRLLARHDVDEVSEPFGRAQKGSSAMPHKRNPIVSEQLCGLARVMRGYASTSLENIALWHERDISHSSTERIIFADALTLLDYMYAKAAWLIDGLVVHSENMLLNIDQQHGLIFSQQLLSELIRHGTPRDTAYRWVQEISDQVRDNSYSHLAAAAQAHPDCSALLGDTIDQYLSVEHTLRNVDSAFAVFSSAV